MSAPSPSITVSNPAAWVSPDLAQEHDGTTGLENHSSPAPVASKRIRLRLACNQCRKRKVRCDAETPKCRNCWLRDEICETTDPRYPDRGSSVRRWATKDGLLPGQNPAATHRNQAYVPKHSQNGSIHATTPSDDGGRPSSDRNNETRDFARRGSTSASLSAMTETSSLQNDAASASPASGDGSVAAGTLSWVARGYQHSISAGGGGEGSINDSNADVVYMGGSSLQCLGMFVDIYLRRKGLPTMSANFGNGMRHVEEFPLSLSNTIPSLPEQRPLKVYLDTFFTKIWPLYPAVDRASVEADVQTFCRLDSETPDGLQRGLTPAHIPNLVSVYAIIVIGADEAAGELTTIAETYLTAAYSLLAHLTASPYLTSVQALLLLSLSLRSRCKDGQGWHVLAQAIRIAHSIGLHRHIRLRANQINEVSEYPELGLKGRVWWSCYALEKLMEIETGRPSAIDDDDIDQVLPSQGAQRDPNEGHELFTDRDPTQEQYPQHITSFLSLQYYQAQITLLRPSLVFPTQSFTDEVKRLGSKLPSYMRLLQAENICTASARAVVRHVVELDDHGIQSHISSVTQPSLAAVVLALHILKNPSKRLIRSDLELLITVTEYIEAQFRRGGQHPTFIRGFETLRTSVLAAVEVNRQPGLSKPAASLYPRQDQAIAEGQDVPSMWDQPQVMPGVTPDTGVFSFGEDLPLEELWGTLGTYSFLEPGLEEHGI
ncbi:hypothetical protein jhhlp_004859 [Lomentospora prolificans]|uniref:Zn(2)-C6 fungal-type domain-containing protein n=1 Tax=Lomentospora prolificans TaxID=41688 RepID=A0A2N3N7Q5_9PEZI|nr:hypothetical protein jhhlp_004859 [Lomentospora prolificans]